MEFTAIQIAAILNGEVIGEETIKVHTLSKIEEGVTGSLTFLANPKYTPYIYTTKASIVIVNQDFTPEKPLIPTLIKVENAYLAFTQLLEYASAHKKIKKEGIEATAYISPSATIGKNVYIGAFTYISDHVIIEDGVSIYPHSYIGDLSVIAAGTIIYPGVKIYPETQIGKNCVIHAGVVIGADGFGFAPNSQGYSKIPQLGNVILEEGVEVGANTTIDRATLGATYIRKGVKIDNHVQIAHNVEIGEDTVIASQTGIAGSAKIGKRAMIGGQVGILGHITIGNDVKIAAQSGVGNNVDNESVIQGSPSFNVTDYRKSYVHFKNFPQIVNKINQLEKKIKE